MDKPNIVDKAPLINLCVLLGQVLLQYMELMTDEQRLCIINRFCKQCGSLDPSCQCWNDE